MKLARHHKIGRLRKPLSRGLWGTPRWEQQARDFICLRGESLCSTLYKALTVALAVLCVTSAVALAADGTLSGTVQNVDPQQGRITVRAGEDNVVELRAPAEILIGLQNGDAVEVKRSGQQATFIKRQQESVRSQSSAVHCSSKHRLRCQSRSNPRRTRCTICTRVRLNRTSTPGQAVLDAHGLRPPRGLPSIPS